MSFRKNYETEIKLRVPGVREARRLLGASGFRVIRRRLFESNVIFDNSARRLRADRCLLRIRRSGRRALLTYKHTPVPGKHKSREELETDVADAGTLQAILARLGLRPVFRYDKYRTEYGRGDGLGVATLDETPIGVFLELEGPAEWIDRVATDLGFDESDYVLASYATLYVDHCRQRGVKPTDMLFPLERGSGDPSNP